MATKQRRGHGEGALFQRNPPHGLWVARIELPAGSSTKRRRKEVTAKTKDLLQAKLREFRRQFAIHGDLPDAGKPLEAWIEYWLSEIAPDRVRPTTLRGYKSTMAHVVAAIGNVRMDKLKPAHIRRLHDAMDEAGLTSTYANSAHRILSRCLKDARAEGILEWNPCEVVDAPRKEVPQLHALDVDQAVKVIESAIPELDGRTEVYSPYPAMWAVALLTGMRRGELIGMELDQLSPDAYDLRWQIQRIASIDNAPKDYEYRELYGSLYLVPVKTQSGKRVIPIVEPLATILRLHLQRAPKNKYGLIFTTPEGLPFDPDTVTAAWETASKQYTDDRVRLHDLRHTTVDLLLEAGVPEDVVVEIVGHADRMTTRGYKSRHKLIRRQEAMKMFTEHLGITGLGT
ncbi:site-specific integrase [Microbacterium sp. YY-01]|uniref:site-specific integrase n=1 Tax=Microbacterium sp. YY-01 TaxID=3421634 RepID=UPI003D179059